MNGNITNRYSSAEKHDSKNAIKIKAIKINFLSIVYKKYFLQLKP